MGPFFEAVQVDVSVGAIQCCCYKSVFVPFLEVLTVFRCVAECAWEFCVDWSVVVSF